MVSDQQRGDRLTLKLRDVGARVRQAVEEEFEIGAAG